MGLSPLGPEDTLAILPEPVGDIPGIAHIEMKLELPGFIAIVRQLDRQALRLSESVDEGFDLFGLRDLAMSVAIDPMPNLGRAAVEPVNGAPPAGVAPAEILLLGNGRRDERDRRLIALQRLTLAGQPQEGTVLATQAGEGRQGLSLGIVPEDVIP